jgi:hypothetical protein
MLPLQFPPVTLLATIVLRSMIEPDALLKQPPTGAWLPENVLFVTHTVHPELLYMQPPLFVAVFPENVQLVTVEL